MSSVSPASTIANARPQAWLRSAAVLACGAFAMGTDSFVLAGILPQISAELRVSDGAAGQVVTAFALTYAVAAPALAALLGHAPRKPLMAAALALFTIANLASAAAPSLPLLLAARVAAALGAAMFTPTASATVAMLAGPERRGQALSMILGGLTVGTVFGVPVGTAIGQILGWRATLFFVAAVSAAALIALAATLPRVAAGPALSLRQRLAAFTTPHVLPVVAVNLLSTSAGFVVYTYISQVVVATGRLSAPALAYALMGWGLGGTLGAFGSGWICDRLGANRTLVIAIVCVGCSLLALAFAAGPLQIILLMAIFGASGWSINTPVNHRLTSLAPSLAPVVISLNSSGVYLGQSIGAMLGGALLIARVDAPLLCIVGAAIAALALLAQLRTMRAGV